MSRDGNRSKRSEQKGLLRSVRFYARCFKSSTCSVRIKHFNGPARFDQAWTELLDSTRYSLAAVTRKMVCLDLRSWIPCYKSICNAINCHTTLHHSVLLYHSVEESSFSVSEFSTDSTSLSSSPRLSELPSISISSATSLLCFNSFSYSRTASSFNLLFSVSILAYSSCTCSSASILWYAASSPIFLRSLI